MIAGLVILGLVNVGLAAALVAVVQQSASERRALIDVVVSRHAGDVRALRREDKRKTGTPPEVAAYEANRDRELIAMGYNPDDVPRIPAGFDGG